METNFIQKLRELEALLQKEAAKEDAKPKVEYNIDFTHQMMTHIDVPRYVWNRAKNASMLLNIPMRVLVAQSMIEKLDRMEKETGLIFSTATPKRRIYNRKKESEIATLQRNIKNLKEVWQNRQLEIG